MKFKKLSLKQKNLLITLDVAVVLAVVIFCLIKYREHQHHEDFAKLQEASQVEVPEETEEEYVSPINFEAAHEVNSDIVAWIQVPNTAVDYPILQSKDDKEEDFYLDHNLDLTGGYPGCIYMQKINSADFTDPVTVVYGHNMKDGTMFRDLHKYEDLDFFNNNSTFYIYTPEETKTYRVVAAVKYDDILIPESYNFFAETTDVLEFLGSLTVNENDMSNHFVTGEDIYGAKSYVVLSTCTSNSSVRYIVVGMQEE